MPKRDALAPRPDGRLYSRPTRRCVAILKYIPPRRRFELIELARELRGKEFPEFLRKEGRKNIPISVARIRDYVGHLHALGLIVEDEKQFSMLATFVKPSTDAEWAQRLSDIAREHLAKLLGIKPGELPEKFEKERAKLFRSEKVPTVAAVMNGLGVEGARQEELFRWSLFLYTDGEACPMEVHRYPHIASKN